MSLFSVEIGWDVCEAVRTDLPSWTCIILACLSDGNKTLGGLVVRSAVEQQTHISNVTVNETC